MEIRERIVVVTIEGEMLGVPEAATSEDNRQVTVVVAPAGRCLVLVQ